MDIKGLKQPLYNYQREGVQFLTSTNGRAILADAPGVGKSAQALAFLVHNNISKSLVICPASVKFAWESEVKKWTKLTPFVIDGSFIKSDVSEVMTTIAQSDVVIINYDLLKKYFDLLQNIRFDCLIVDEFHAIKNNKAIRTKAVKVIAKKIPRVLLLSGTPMLNRPVELFNGLQIIDPSRWSNWVQYVQRYCAAYRRQIGPYVVWDTSGASNLDELRERIKPYFLRRTKAEVLTELPPKNFITVPVRLPSEIQKLYNKAEKSLAEYLKEYKEKTTEEIRRSMAAARLVKLNELRQLTTRGKTEMAEDLIEQLLEDGEKIIVFSVYNEPLDYLANKYGTRAVSITGKTPVEERGRLIEMFQRDSGPQIFLGGTKAAGVGITLTAASNVIFIDYDWVPAIMEQASDRAHRIGQNAESVNIYQIYAKDTIDDYMSDILKEKQTLVDQLIEGKTPEKQEQSVVETLFKNVEAKYNN